ncbi:hypothetical protein MmTuc01_3046 [Methanosarcina mazei Tuc01]|uniref:Uncharacterized protein n=1 Tax=Methanosarcina mazei Tuc01 TaxID=1236903 RepID=M1Q7K3_METMZ|nr:hypothetical protein MmTuc01_3046 [Methanosarcina mazei Tuc01]
MDCEFESGPNGDLGNGKPELMSDLDNQNDLDNRISGSI